jgi:PAS domain S-box-containing protein
MIRSVTRHLRTILVFTFCIALVALVTWFIPALSAAVTNALFRWRGALTPSADIVVIAIDDASLQRVSQQHGVWPWPRVVMAELLDQLTVAQPAAVGLDVIYAESTTANDDQRLAEALRRNGRVVLPTQLYENGATTDWLRPLPQLAQAAAALGHAHAAPGIDGTVRSIQLSKANDRAERLWAFSLAVVNVAAGNSSPAISETAGRLQFGSYPIPVLDGAPALAATGVTVLRGNEMLINFAGPAGTFTTYSFADVLAGQVPHSAFKDKLVLIGATAESLGDSRVVPFMHFRVEHNPNGRREGGQEMPGVEIHANTLHSIRQGIALRVWPDWLNFLAALGVVLAVACVLERFAGWQQLAWLGGLLITILAGSYFAFSRAYLVPPLAPMLTGFLAVVPLLLNRALTASRELDIKLAALLRSQQGFLSNEVARRTDFIHRQLSLTLPQSLAWKLNAVDELTARVVARMSFVNRTLSSMNEGVLVADLHGRIVYANQEAQQLFGCAETELLQARLIEFLGQHGTLETSRLHEAVLQAHGGQHTQLELTIRQSHFALSLAPLTTETRAPQTIGVVALLADITKRVELDRVKTETLQLVSHELRTPLTSIQGLSDVLRKFPVDAAQTREMLDTIHAEALRLGETINRYLDLTRLESGAQTLRLETVNTAQWLEECARNMAVPAAERHIRIVTELPADLPALRLDKQLMTQAVGNLLSNAIKYSPPATAVTLRASADAQGFSLHVGDEGFGIPPQARERIFEKFYRLARDTQSDIVGTGLGLALVKEIVERHGGQVSFVDNETAGTTFTIRLQTRETER